MPVSLLYYGKRILATALLGSLLVACNISVNPAPTQIPASPIVVTATGTPAVVPTIVPQLPTLTPIPATAIPSPVAQPIIGFEPQAGGPNTPVSVFGSGYTPGEHVVVRLGFPDPMGEVLASSVVDTDGRWSAALVIPERLPSGELITNGNMYLVAMDEENRPLASAPFGFIRGAEPPTDATPQAEWPGPGWVFAVETDANADGLTDTVYYRPSAAAPERTFDDPRLAAVAVAADEIMIVQDGAHGPWTMLRIDSSGAYADIALFEYDPNQQRLPAGYMLALDPARGPYVNVLPVGASGAGYGGPYGIDWDQEANGFRLVTDPAN